MSDMQNMLAALIAAIKEKRITVDVAEAAVRMLNGIPDYSHVDAIKALLRTPSSDEEQPEDYLAVKTFTSTELHVGDEIVSDKTKNRAVITALDKENQVVYYVTFDGRNEGLPNFLRIESDYSIHRTGRNFPAIPAILEELKKA